MKCCKILFLFFFLSSLSIFSQEKYKKHTVAKGETISEIAKKYKITSTLIYELNPDAVNGIKLNTVLLIPTKYSNSAANKTESTAQISEKLYEVQPKETVFGIAKQCKISVADLYKINPDLEKEGLKIGQTIKIPIVFSEELDSKSNAISNAKDTNQNNEKTKKVSVPKSADKATAPLVGITHEVAATESYYSIAKKYDIKPADLQKANPELVNKALKVGQKINVPVQVDLNLASAKVVATPEAKKETILGQSKSSTAPPKHVAITAESKNKETAKVAEVDQKITRAAYISTVAGRHEVLAGETLYSIAKQMGMKLTDLRKANPEIGNKPLKLGQKINVPIQQEIIISSEPHQLSSDKNVIIRNEKSGQSKVVAAAILEVDETKAMADFTHEVLAKETKYGIAKQYGVSVLELEKQNPSTVKKLLVGSLLKIRTSKVMEENKVVASVVVQEDSVVNESSIETSNITKINSTTFVEKLISKASLRLGTPYRSGGTSEAGFDCSGLMCYTFDGCDIKLPRSSSEMATYGSKIENSEAQKGDLIFFKTRGSGRINHVGLVVEVLDDEIKFIHSATHGGVIISSTKESYYQKNLVQVNRVL